MSWTADDFAFREYAFCILCLASGGDKFTLIDQRRILELKDKPLWNLYSARISSNDRKGNREFFSGLANGFHLEPHPVGSAPQTSKYWFEGALICLVPRLDQPDVVIRAMADAVRYAKDCHGRTTFNAVLVSIIHFVRLKRFPDGSVEHTKALPLFNTK